eukprot:365442-Chlamydomonas_euryale.AAC.2
MRKGGRTLQCVEGGRRRVRTGRSRQAGLGRRRLVRGQAGTALPMPLQDALACGQPCRPLTYPPPPLLPHTTSMHPCRVRSTPPHLRVRLCAWPRPQHDAVERRLRRQPHCVAREHEHAQHRRDPRKHRIQPRAQAVHPRHIQLQLRDAPPKRQRACQRKHDGLQLWQRHAQHVDSGEDGLAAHDLELGHRVGVRQQRRRQRAQVVVGHHKQQVDEHEQERRHQRDDHMNNQRERQAVDVEQAVRPGAAAVRWHALCHREKYVERRNVERAKEDRRHDARKLDVPEEREGVVLEAPRDPHARRDANVQDRTGGCVSRVHMCRKGWEGEMGGLEATEQRKGVEDQPGGGQQRSMRGVGRGWSAEEHEEGKGKEDRGKERRRGSVQAAGGELRTPCSGTLPQPSCDHPLWRASCGSGWWASTCSRASVLPP